MRTVSTISLDPGAYITPKAEDHYKMTFTKYLRFASFLQHCDDDLWKGAVRIINALRYIAFRGRNDALLINSEDRSDYHHALKEMSEKAWARFFIVDQTSFDDIDWTGITIREYQYAETIVDLCYNYQLEYSVRNSSKHYSISEFESNDPNDWISFSKDFFSRLESLWSTGNPDERFLLDEDNEFVRFKEYNKQEGSPDFATAVDFIRQINKKYVSTENIPQIPRYEYELNKRQRQLKRSSLKWIFRSFALLSCSFIAACAIDFASQVLQCVLESDYSDLASLRSVLVFGLKSFVFLSIGELLPKVVEVFVNKIYKKDISIPSLSDIVKEFQHIATNINHLARHKPDIYVNPYNVDLSESFSESRPITYILPYELKEYFKLKRTKSEYFTTSSVYPLADGREKNLEELIRMEEIYNYRFGIVYQSGYNSLVVDPISVPDDNKSKIKPYYPYERIIPTKGNGVVMVTKYRDKYVVLNQFRHAPRKYQYSFPRGYAEEGVLSIDNAVKELGEEIKATVIKAPILIGMISPDSGLTSSCVSVYYVEISNYDPAVHKEGIESIELFSEDEIENMIAKNAANMIPCFDDGFTLAAYQLYKIFKQTTVGSRPGKHLINEE